MPETSIIVRTYNEERHLGNLLAALKNQDYQNFEVIIVDSGSTDRTLEIAKEFNTKIIRIESRDFTFGYALNLGCEAAQGDYLVFASAHVLPVDNSWIGSLVGVFKDEKVAMVYGRQVGAEESKFSEKKDFLRLFKGSGSNSEVPLYYANNANSAIRKSLWGGHPFDQHLFGLEDIDWARKMTKLGYSVRYEPKAAIYHIHTEAWHQVFNRYRREAIAAVRIGLDYPPQARIEFAWLLVRVTDDLLSSFPNWSRGRVEEILRFRYYQWKGSRVGWKQGSGINFEKYRENIFFHWENRALVIKDRNHAELEEVSEPQLRPGDILIRVEYVGICRTDLEVLEGTLGYYKSGLAKYPIIPGHEFSGTIVRVGSNQAFQERFKTGFKVIGECILSRDPENRKEVGVINYNGAYGRYIVIPGDFVHRVPDALDLRFAALAEPLAVVLRAFRRLKPRLAPKSNVAVIGAGPIGNLFAQVMNLEGYVVTVFDKNSERLNFLNNKVKEILTDIRNLGKFDAIIEATGSGEILERVLNESGMNSTLLLLGFPYKKIDYNFEDLVGREKVIIGSVGGEREDFVRALEVLQKLDLAPFIKTIYPLEDFKKAWEELRSGRQFKIMLKP